MKKSACLLSLLMLLVPLAGCAGSEDDCCEDLDRNIIASDTVTIEPDSVATVTIKDFEDSQESYARELMKSPYYGNDPDCDIHPAGEGGCEGENLTFEETLEVMGGNATHNPGGYLYEEQWADYEGYEWEVNLLSETGKYDVLWLDVVESIRFSNHGDLGKINAKPALTKKGMTGSNSLGPKLSPEHSCGEVFDDYVIHCPVTIGYKAFNVLIANTGSTAIELEYSIFGWAGEVEEATERFELGSGTAEFDQDSVLFPFHLTSFTFGDYQLTLETAARDIMENHVSGNMTYEGAIEILESMGRNSTFYEQSAQWDNYDEYSWEIVLVSGSGTWDVLWLDYEKSVAINSVGPDSDLWRNWSSTLNERGMDSSGSKGPLAKPEQTCSGDPDNEVRWLTPYGFKNNCTAGLIEESYNDIYTFNIYSLSGEDFVLEWKVFGWK